MTPMLEKAARAVDPWAFDLDNRHLSPEYRQGLATDIARAVLLAIREPDEETAEAGNRADYYASEGCDINYLNSGKDGQPATAVVFTAMIDAILSGEGG